MTLTETARAKLNLALHVRRKRADGYHDLETIFAFVEAGDELTLLTDGSGAPMLTIDGPFSASLQQDDENLVTRAARVLGSAAGVTKPIALRLTKNLPVASGIGGGSADAAAALRLLNRHWGLHWPIERLATLGATLGADVAACVWSQTMRGDGRGELLQPVDDAGLAETPVLLVNPGVAVSTAAVFAGWGGVDYGPLADGDPISVAAAGRNDLEAPARALEPVIGDVLDALAEQQNATFVRMSGSGATCFALFASDAARDAAACAIAGANSRWWIMPTRLA